MKNDSMSEGGSDSESSEDDYGDELQRELRKAILTQTKDP